MMLDAHPEMAIPPETHFIPDLARELKPGFDRDRFADLVTEHRRWGDFHLEEADLRSRLHDGDADTIADGLRTFYGLYAEAHGKSRWGDKTPKYLTKMRRIASVLPEAAFIHLIRDGRDVALSKSDRSGRPASKSARIWRRRIERARTQAQKLDRYLELRYESLVADPEPHLREICSYLQLDFDPAMLRYYERASERLSELGDARRQDKVNPASERRAAHARATRPPDEARVERWRKEMSAEDLQIFEDEAGTLLAELGYPRGH